MPDQHGLGDNGTESTRPRQSDQGDDQMNEYDSEVAHPGNGINTSKTTALRPIGQFAIDRYWMCGVGGLLKLWQGGVAGCRVWGRNSLSRVMECGESTSRNQANGSTPS